MKRYGIFYLFAALLFAYTTATPLFAFDDPKVPHAIFQTYISIKNTLCFGLIVPNYHPYNNQ